MNKKENIFNNREVRVIALKMGFNERDIRKMYLIREYGNLLNNIIE